MSLSFKHTKSLIIILLMLGLHYSCTGDYKSREKEANKSYSELRSDLDILQMGKSFHDNPTSKQIAYSYIEMLVKERNYTQALYHLTDIKEFFLPDSTYWRLYYRAALGGHHFEEVQKVPARLFHDSTHIEKNIITAKAIMDYNTLLSENPCNEITYLERGEAFLSINELHAAESDYRKALECNPASFKAFYNVLNVNYAKEKYAEASSIILENRSLIQEFLQNEQEIISVMHQTFDQLHEINQNNTLLPKEKHYKKANIFIRLQNFEFALSEVNKAIELDRSYSDAFALRAFIYLNMNKLSLAYTDIQRAENLSGKGTTELHKIIINKLNATKQ